VVEYGRILVEATIRREVSATGLRLESLARAEPEQILDDVANALASLKPVTSAQTSGCHFNDNAGFRASGVIYGDYFGQLLESLVKHCTQYRSPRRTCRGVTGVPMTDNLIGRMMTKPAGSSL
jgi:hypothetical protein